MLAQAFPVPRNGGTIKFKLGISAPVEVMDDTKARLVLPAVVERNFSFASDVSHGVWIEGKQALAISTPGLTASHPDARLFRISGALGDRDLSRIRPTIAVDRNLASGYLAARIDDGELVVQEVVRSDGHQTDALMLVIDGSAGLADRIDKLAEALDAIPSGIKVGAIIAAEPMQQVALASWTAEQKQRVVKLLRSVAFIGGQDNAPALAEALQLLEAEPKAKLLWVHGPQPVSFRDSGSRLEQASARLSRLPDLVLYGVEPGPNEVLPDAPWAWAARALPRTGTLEADLSGFFAGMSSQVQTPMIRRTQSQAADGRALASDHIYDCGRATTCSI